MSDRNNLYRFGDVYMMQFSGIGSEQHGWRPGLIFQNNTGNLYSPNIIALPFTTSLKKAGQPTHVIIKASESGLRYDSMVLCENPERMSKDRVGNYITTLPNDCLERICAASMLATSAITFITPEVFMDLIEFARKLNTAGSKE